MPCVPSKTAICIWGGFCWVRYLSAIPKASITVAMSAATWYNDIPLSSSTAMLYYMSVFNPLLRSPVDTYVLQFNCLSFFIFTIFYDPHISNLVIPFLCTTPSSALGNHVTSLPMPTALPINCFKGSEYHDSYTWIHQNRNNQLNIWSHLTNTLRINLLKVLTAVSLHNEVL